MKGEKETIMKKEKKNVNKGTLTCHDCGKELHRANPICPYCNGDTYKLTYDTTNHVLYCVCASCGKGIVEFIGAPL